MSVNIKRNKILEKIEDFEEDNNLSGITPVVNTYDVELLEVFLLVCKIQSRKKKIRINENSSRMFEDEIKEKQQQLQETQDYYLRQDIEMDLDTLEMNRQIEEENVDMNKVLLYEEMKEYEMLINDSYFRKKINKIKNFTDKIKKLDYESLNDLHRLLNRLFDVTKEMMKYYDIHRRYHKEKLYDPNVIKIISKYK